MRSLEQAAWDLEVSALIGAVASRRTGEFRECPECGEPVEVIEDMLPILTSSGRRARRSTRRALMHAKRCYDAFMDRVATAEPIELWPDRSDPTRS